LPGSLVKHAESGIRSMKKGALPDPFLAQALSIRAQLPLQ
jgi:hypothetical protein